MSIGYPHIIVPAPLLALTSAHLLLPAEHELASAAGAPLTRPRDPSARLLALVPAHLWWLAAFAHRYAPTGSRHFPRAEIGSPLADGPERPPLPYARPGLCPSGTPPPPTRSPRAYASACAPAPRSTLDAQKPQSDAAAITPPSRTENVTPEIVTPEARAQKEAATTPFAYAPATSQLLAAHPYRYLPTESQAGPRVRIVIPTACAPRPSPLRASRLRHRA
mmetsp:Transcript_4246/g.9203  ORF Transcript_4246/g.9203 Transcript_4246/m.9203 type:complete len:221 (+) Transcript_4246:604-1266(+)